MNLLSEDVDFEVTIVFPKRGVPRLYSDKPDHWTPQQIAMIVQGGISAFVNWGQLFGVLVSGQIGPPGGMPNASTSSMTPVPDGPLRAPRSDRSG